MTALFVKTFLCWLRDDSADFQRTRNRLDRNLHWLETAARVIPGGRFGGDATRAQRGSSDDAVPGDDTGGG